MPLHLERISVRAHVQPLFVEIDVEQHYRNVGRWNRTAIYILELPKSAALLEMQVHIEKRQPAPRVRIVRLGSAAAPDEQGETLLIEQAAPGLYALAMGELGPDESVVVRYRYAAWLEIHAQQARLNIPVTVAPPVAKNSYIFELAVLFATAADARAIRCLTHEMHAVQSAAGLSLTLTGREPLAHDCVLVFANRLPEHHTELAHAGDDWVAFAHWTVPEYPVNLRTPRLLKVLIDCSDSRSTDCLARMHRVYAAVLTHLHDLDEISVTIFGEKPQSLLKGVKSVTSESMKELRLVDACLDADLGEANVESALNHVEKKRNTDPVGEVLFITTGDAWVSRRVHIAAALGYQRIFLIVVGDTPERDQMRDLAALTNGAYELLTAEEESEAVVARMMKRIRAPAYQVQTVHWPQTPAWSTVLTPAVFPGDTVQVLARFSSVPQGAINVEVQTSQGEQLQLSALRLNNTVSTDPLLLRMAAEWQLHANTVAALLERQYAENKRFNERERALIVRPWKSHAEMTLQLIGARPIYETLQTPMQVLLDVLRDLRAGEDTPVTLDSLRISGMPKEVLDKLYRENHVEPMLPEYLVVRLWLALAFRKLWQEEIDAPLQALLDDPAQRPLLLIRRGLPRQIETLTATSW
jgi:hypothetical protein